MVLRRFGGVMLRMERGEAQHEESGEGGEDRARQDAGLGFLGKGGRSGKGEGTDEQAHGEADSAQQGETINLQPSSAARQAGDTQADGSPDRAENAALLAEK